jgi:hypothetical protein
MAKVWLRMENGKHVRGSVTHEASCNWAKTVGQKLNYELVDVKDVPPGTPMPKPGHLACDGGPR